MEGLRRRGVRRSIIAAAAAGFVLLAASAGGATDGFGNTSVTTVSVAAGGSATAAQIVHLDALPQKGDVLLAFDDTGSMGPALATAKTDATSIVSTLQTDFSGFGGSVQFAVGHFQDYGGTAFDSAMSDVPWQLDQPLTTDPTAIQNAIPPTAGGGGDFPESYFRVFYEASVFPWQTGAERFLIVLGDQTGHDPAQQATFADCPNSSATTGVDPGTTASGPLSAATAINDLTQANVTLSFVHYDTGANNFPVPKACHDELAAATGGSAVDGGASGVGSVATQVESLVQRAARHIGSLTAAATTSTGGNTPDPNADPGSWVSFTGLPSTLDLAADGSNSDVPFSAVVAPPAGAVPGTYSVDLKVVADNVVRTTETLTITVKTPISSLNVSATPTSVGAGIDQIKLSNIPNAWLGYYAGSILSGPVGSTPVGSTPVGSTPVGSTPVGSTPVGSTPVGSTPVGSTPVGSTPVGSTGLFDMPVGSTPVGSTALSSVLLSQIGLTGTTWDQILCAPLAGQPLPTLTLGDLKKGVCSSTQTSLDRFEALPLKQVDLTTTLLKSVHWSTLLMGNTPLSSLAGGFNAWCDPATGLIPQSGGSCAGATGSTTVLQLDVAGQLASAPVGSTPVGSTPVGSTPVGSTPVGSTAITASRLATIPLSTINPLTGIIDCTKVNCATGTLGDAYAASAIDPTVTFSAAPLIAAMNTAQITINDIVVAVIGAAGFPWELLPLQGLQPYSKTQPHVTYRLSASVDCSVASSFTFTARLPSGFFPVNGSASISFDGGATSQPAGAPTVLGTSPGAAAKLNSYQWPLACGNLTAPVNAVLSFDSFVGLQLGTFSMSATAATGGFSLSSTGVAPVTVGQNGEPANDDPTTAPTITPDTLVLGHLAFSGDQDFYQLSLNGLPRGTKVSVFLKVPTGADFDLTVNRPATQPFFSTPVGSTPVGSTPIEDSGVGFATTGQAFPSETLQDVPVGSTPVGSTPVGSTPVGSTSTTRGDANEAAQIITTGEAGMATIGVTGYNGATSNSSYELRVKETPPPALPASCPARSLGVSSANQGTLPASLPATTKSLFIINKQRLVAMYGSAAVSSLLSGLNTLTARSEVAGAVLAVDGNAAVRSAYGAWDGNPCDVNLANTVVRSINDVVASYRNSTTGLPNLHYIVLLGTDEAVPMARTPDPVTLSPEENAAADLAFTTNGLSTGNALYTSVAQNNILTDGAYGAFTSIPWLGHDLLLPQLSISRLVESPADMLGQINRYLGLNGISAPQTAAGTLNPQKILPTGYDFLADGAQAVRNNLHTVGFGAATLQDTVGLAANPSINVPGLAQPPWTAGDVLTTFLRSASPADIASLNAHYNHYELEAADGSLASTADASAALAARILFTMGCHGGLNVPDTLGGSGGRYLDWAQLFSTKQVAMYIANTGFGYGDSASVALSERLLSIFAKNLHSDSNSVGEEWAASLQQYFATAGAYDVYDEKVMEETTFYGLPFWHFSTAGSGTSFTPLTTSADPLIGVQSATINFPGPGATTQSQFGLYRPILPITSQEVTSSSLPARGLWIKSLVTNDVASTATVGFPTIDLAAHESVSGIRPIFFPASPFMLEHSNVFGKQRDYANVSSQFRPDPNSPSGAGIQRNIVSASLELFYSNTSDRIPPLISQVNVAYSGTTANVQAHVTDDSGTVVAVAALVNDGAWHYVLLTRSSSDPTLFSANTTAAVNPEVFVEATDGSNVAYSANKGSNFTSAPAGAPVPAQILLQAPLGPYGPNQPVNATYQCIAGDTPVAQCTGTVPNGQPIDTSSFGMHTFVVKALDASGAVVGSLQRTYIVEYGFKGFFQPVDNQPVLNVVKAGSAVPVKFSLTGDQGLNIFFDPSYPKSQVIACDASAPADGVETTVTAGQSSLSYSAGSDQYTYVWKTDPSWSNTCRALIVKTKDGIVHRADFQFK